MSESTAPPSTGNLPSDSSSFVGREAELRSLQKTLSFPGALVTLVGAPGIGKTRLALRYAELFCNDDAPVTPLLVDMSAARDERDLCRAVGLLLGVLFTDDDLVTPVGRALEARSPLLLILDNFETVVETGTEVVAAWAKLAPSLRLLITSRELLRLPREQPLELEPLPVPDATASVAEAVRYPAARLLLDRAVGMHLTSQNVGHVVEILQELDGIPLVIELAAARLGVLRPDQLLERMPQRLDLLSRSRARDVNERGATLRGALDWSWDALDDVQRRALAAASVFDQGFTLEAFEAVAGLDGTAGVDALQALTDKSLVRTITQPDQDFSIRFTLYESVRAYAAEQLERLQGGAAPARIAHAYFFAEKGWEAREAIEGPQSDRYFEWLTTELENLLAAERTLAAQDHPSDQEQRLRALLASGAVFAQRGPVSPYVGRLRAASSHALFGSTPDELQSTVRLELGRMLSRVGDMEAAEHTLRAALEDAPLGPPRAALEVEVGSLLQATGRLTEAESSFARAEAELRVDQQDRVRIRLLAGRGLLHHSQGHLDDASRAYEASLGLARRVGARGLEAHLSKDLGTIRLQQRRFEEAREHYNHVLSLTANVHDASLLGIVEGNLAILEQETGALEQAESHFERGLAQVRCCGSRLLEAHLLGYLGALLHERGALEDAASHYKRAIEMLRDIGDRRLEGIFLAALGAADATRNRCDAAAEAFAAAERLLEPIGDEGLFVALELHRGHLTLRQADQRAQSGDASGAEAERGKAFELLERADGDWAEILGRSDDARFAARLLESRTRRDTVVVQPSAGRILIPGLDPIELSNRQPLRRIVSALATARVDTPGEPLIMSALIEAGWPGERMTHGAANNRAKVALSTLRKLGLRDLLVRRDDGYLLDPAVPVMIEE